MKPPLHLALPQTFTPEKLGSWFVDNCIDKRTHTEEIALDDKSKAELKEKIALTTRAIYELKDVEAAFKKSLKKGTPFNGEERVPEDFQIPPTKGLDALEENRKFADDTLKKGFLEKNTDIYGIPWHKKVVYFDIEGKLFYDEKMTDEQLASVGGLFDEEAPVTTAAKEFKKSMKKLANDSDVTITGSMDGEELFKIEPDTKEDIGTSPSELFS